MKDPALTLSTACQIRDAQPDDASGIAEIYNHAVLHSTAIWNDQVIDADNRRRWMNERHAQGFPVLVAVDAQGQVMAYGSFGHWRPFDGYRHTVEHSVYVRNTLRRSGLGRALMEALIARARALDKHVMVAAITADNAPSIGLHKSLGFEVTGRMPEVGTKFGQWLDLVFMQLRLDSQPPEPRGRIQTP